MRQILLVEDSNMFGRLAKKKIEKVFDIPVFWAKDYAETEKLLRQSKENFTMALLDYNLPDAPRGEVIDLVTGAGISTFVFTANMSEEVREDVWSKKVADYILKDDPNSLEYIIAAMRQLGDNQHNLVLIVDDSGFHRTMLSELLYIRQYRVINAQDGQSALNILQQYPEVKLVITDFNMPGMDGCLLCQKIREQVKPDRLAIIGMSADGDKNIAARFIKSGANDFIVKNDFLVEEFYCRVNHCLETVNLFGKIREGAIRDFMTGLYNRRYFFDKGQALVARSRTAGERLNCVMLDIDHFKSVNDTYGHDVGDQVICNLAAVLKEDAGDNDIVARIGGEEFALLVPSLSPEDMLTRLEALRYQVENAAMARLPDGMDIGITISVGLCSEVKKDLDTMMKHADDLLYQAKEGGRNRVCY